MNHVSRPDELPVLTSDRAARQRDRERGGSQGAFDADMQAHQLQRRTDTVVAEERVPEGIGELPGAAASGLESGELALTRTRQMYAGREEASVPVELSTSWIPLDLAEAAGLLREDDAGPGGLYSRLADVGHGPASFTERVKVRVPGEEERGFLRLDQEQRVFEVTRVATDGTGRVVEVDVIVLAADRWELVYTWPA